MNSITKLFSLKNKTVILTGSAGRLGSRFAHVLTDAGADVVLVDTDEQKNRKLEKSLIKKYGARPLLSTTDISNQSQIKKMVKCTLKKYGKIDVLINNGHFFPREEPKIDAPFEEYPLELWEQTTKKNITGLFLCCQEIGKVMNITKERTVDVMITRLRQKIEVDPKNPKYFQTIRGSGYVLWIE